MQWNKPSLAFLDLNDIEISILESINEPLNPTDISNLTKQVRTSISYNLKRLVARGLVERIRSGKRHLYVSRSPAEIRRMLQQASDTVGVQQSGVRVKTEFEHEFIIHVGTEEIVPAFARIAIEIKNDRVKAIQHHLSYIDQVSVLSKEQAVSFNHAIIKNKIIVEGLLNESAYGSYLKRIQADPESFRSQIETLGGRIADYGVFPDDMFSVHSEIWIFKTTTLIINWKDKIAIEITDKNMTGLLKDMFEQVKEQSRKIDHNEMMRKLEEALSK